MVSEQTSFMAPLMRIAQKAAGAALDVLVPPRCFSCDRLIASHGGLCAVCWCDLPLIEEPICPRTGNPFAYEMAGTLTSAEAHLWPLSYRKMRAAACYNGVAKKLIVALKFHDQPNLAPHLAQLMHRSGARLLQDCDLIVPVPLHKTRLQMRRFNQAAVLAHHVSRLSGVPNGAQMLERVRSTHQQARLNRHERRENVQGAFHVPASYAASVYGKRIVLIDDVVTTGETINACARALLREKATYVDVLTFAKVVDGTKIPI